MLYLHHALLGNLENKWEGRFKCTPCKESLTSVWWRTLNQSTEASSNFKNSRHSKNVKRYFVLAPRRLQRTLGWHNDANTQQDTIWSTWFPWHGRRVFILLYVRHFDHLPSNWSSMSVLWKQVQERWTESSASKWLVQKYPQWWVGYSSTGVWVDFVNSLVDSPVRLFDKAQQTWSSSWCGSWCLSCS